MPPRSGSHVLIAAKSIGEGGRASGTQAECREGAIERGMTFHSVVNIAFGGPAVIGILPLDQKLCVPAFRRVCHYRVALLQVNYRPIVTPCNTIFNNIFRRAGQGKIGIPRNCADRRPVKFALHAQHMPGKNNCCSVMRVAPSIEGTLQSITKISSCSALDMMRVY